MTSIPLEFQILLLLLIHWFADFVCQTNSMALNKSKDNFWLSIHVFVYCIIWTFSLLFFFPKELVGTFVFITFVVHFLTDWITSRISGYYYKNERRKAFFVTVGFDQFAHYVQLIICYKYILL